MVLKNSPPGWSKLLETNSHPENSFRRLANAIYDGLE
jgi:hypothetical protein